MMNKRIKGKLNPPTGINDPWNQTAKWRLPPNHPDRKGEYPKFTAQEEKEVMNHFYENGFC